jgi:ABC-type Mn2+/Zn2+ transport system permease subunit
MAAGSLFGALSALGGLYIAWYADVSPSAAIVLTACGFFLLAFLVAPGRGLLWQRRYQPA